MVDELLAHCCLLVKVVLVTGCIGVACGLRTC